MSSSSCGCLDGLRRLKSRSGRSETTSALPIDFAELDLGVPLEDVSQQRLVQLTTTLESIDESRSATDRQLLARLIARYHEAFGAVRSPLSAAAEDVLPEVDPISPCGLIYKMLPLPGSESRPILDGTTASSLIQHLQQTPEEPLHPHFLAKLLRMVESLHWQRAQEYGPVLHLDMPGSSLPKGAGVKLTEKSARSDPRVIILGDTHGQLADVFWAISQFGLPSEKNVYVVNGDVADRSMWSTEIFTLFFVIMLQYPNENVVVLNRGNHECVIMNGSRCGGFATELLQKYGPDWGPYIHGLFGSVFALMPVATILHDSIVIMHGGVGRCPEEQMNLLNNLTLEHREPSINSWGIDGDPYLDAMVDTLWSDPGDKCGSEVNNRGCGHVWGPDYTNRFLQATGAKLIVRSHQVPRSMTGAFVHESHDRQVVTVFSASNYGGRGNTGGVVIVSSAETELEVAPISLGICPPFTEVQSMPLTSASGTFALHHPQPSAADNESSASNDYTGKFRDELLQQVMGLLAEFRKPLWEACTSKDRALKGFVNLGTWTKICTNTTRIRGVDWALVARLVGGTTRNNVRYMDTLNRFGFKIASKVVASDLAESVLSRIFEKMMHADESLHQLLGKLCRAGKRQSSVHEMLAGFCELLAQNDVTGLEMDAVARSLEAHIGSQTHGVVDIADFLSAWKCASGVRADLDLTSTQVELASRIARLLSAPPKQKYKRRLSTLAPASASKLMQFFTSADQDGDGYMSIEEGVCALRELLMRTTECEDSEEEISTKLRDLLSAVDVTGARTLNYLEFLRLFDRQDPQKLTHQSLLDALCFQVWAHRNALSGLFRYIGKNGRVTESQIRWALAALNSVVGGQLVEANIDSLVSAVSFKNDTVAAEEFLHSFKLSDSQRKSRKPSIYL
eukprot:TRINITY_DN25564_c0_g1_i1.p1 TRINITY_DN25564_c0_g1~~TRINITY_DN25564_c0_g1_i1.p1  ORF type:complete len:921 (-),score=111.40 TRINITY_DN25564_c0_g1_i1:15-2738(-)